MKLAERWEAYWREKTPECVEPRSIRVFGPSGELIAARAAVKIWGSRERVRRGFERSFRLLVPFMLGALPFAFLEPFFFMIWGSIYYGLLVAVAGPMLFAKFHSEEATFFGVEGRCPRCGAEGSLGPYFDSRWDARITLHCSKCGETCVAEA